MVQSKKHSVYDEVYNINPNSLQANCLTRIVSCLPSLTTQDRYQDEDGGEFKNKLMFAQPVCIPNRIAEKVLEECSKTDNLNNDTLSLFADTCKYNLKVLKLVNVNMMWCGAQLLHYDVFAFKKIELSCNFGANWCVNKLAASFAGSRDTLSHLKLDMHTGGNFNGGTIFDFFIQFPNLKFLFYDSPVQGNGNAFTNANWSRLLSTCRSLQLLHINFNSLTREVELDSEIFATCSSLRSLSLYSALMSNAVLQSFQCIHFFLYLDNLSALDLSTDFDPRNLLSNNSEKVAESHVNKFLELSTSKLKLLESLDVSGLFYLDDFLLQRFVESHKNLTFLGLCMARSKFCMNGDVAEYYDTLNISGCYLERQIIVSLLRYNNRSGYMSEVLKGLFYISSGWDRRKPRILKIVLEVMDRFKDHLQLQMSATACVFHLTKDHVNMKEEEKDFNAVLLSEVAQTTLATLCMYIGSIQMVKNCLLIVCADKILQKARFDYVAMCHICLICMLKFKETTDRHVTRMAVAILSILACKISSKEITSLIKIEGMTLLLDIVEKRLNENFVDGTLKFNLSALWNLTDESPATCKLFIDLGGLGKYLFLLESLSIDYQVETKVLGLLNNIAEVKELHEYLVENVLLMTQVRHLISSQHVQVSYFACGIVANLALSCYDNSTLDMEGMLTEMSTAVKRWGCLKADIVTYRTFRPFYGLLQCDTVQIQQWAVWAIHHVCMLSPTHYCEMMSDECLQMLGNVHRSNMVDSLIPELCEEIYTVLKKSPH